ncbi:MAG: amidohydrolase family protein, partial [bacterium]
LKKHETTISHNPESNMKLGAGMAPVTEFIEAGIPVGLGTDGAASNNDLDLFAEMDTAGKLQKVRHHDPRVLNARQITRMATLDGARALGLEEKTGSLEAGKKADFIAIDLQQLHLKPIYDIYSQICYSISGHDVTDSWINGRQVVKDGNVLTMDEENLLEEVTRENHKINQQRKQETDAITS